MACGRRMPSKARHAGLSERGSLIRVRHVCFSTDAKVSSWRKADLATFL